MAKVMVATKETQGRRKNDFCWATEGEILRFGMECDGEEVDGGCGCRRSLVGVDSMKATTTAKVVEMPGIDEKSLATIVGASLTKAGWGHLAPKEDFERYAADDAAELLRIAATFNEGDVIEKRGETIQTR